MSFLIFSRNPGRRSKIMIVISNFSLTNFGLGWAPWWRCRPATTQHDDNTHHHAPINASRIDHPKSYSIRVITLAFPNYRSWSSPFPSKPESKQEGKKERCIMQYFSHKVDSFPETEENRDSLKYCETTFSGVNNNYYYALGTQEVVSNDIRRRTCSTLEKTIRNK